ncbi:MAG: PH domain-containing protein [Proteobacteria bacterium]|nr:PH domain-containing protein [Pseudomonadota bacterium]MBU1543957.1 PH domain-containing protein [Pseudomonadota bacterium]MBU2479932.1 PH domain-containing protein [Pseudomonadota bacterium]
MNERELWQGRPSLWNVSSNIFKLIKTLIAAGLLLYCSRYLPENFVKVPEIGLPEFFSKITGEQFYLLAFFSLLIVRRVWGIIHQYINILCIEIKLTDERLHFREGILNKFQKGIELYRIKDLSIYEPFLFRLLGLQNIQIVASDKTIGFPRLMGVPKEANIYELLKNYVESARTKKGVKEVDYFNG